MREVLVKDLERRGGRVVEAGEAVELSNSVSAPLTANYLSSRGGHLPNAILHPDLLPLFRRQSFKQRPERLKTPVERTRVNDVYGGVEGEDVRCELFGLLFAVAGERGIGGDARGRLDAAGVFARRGVDDPVGAELMGGMELVKTNL